MSDIPREDVERVLEYVKGHYGWQVSIIEQLEALLKPKEYPFDDEWEAIVVRHPSGHIEKYVRRTARVLPGNCAVLARRPLPIPPLVEGEGL